MSEPAHRHHEIFRTARMRPLVSEKLVSKLVTGRDHHVVHSVSPIFGDRQHRPPKAGQERVALARFYIKCGYPAVWSRQPFGPIISIIGEEVSSLSALGGDYSYALVLLNQNCAPFTSRYRNAQSRCSSDQGPSRGPPTSISSGLLSRSSE